MRNGLECLERLFTYKRKPSRSSNGGADLVSQPPGQRFPSPSFIRPKTSRMTARDEVRLRRATGRSPSVPEILASQRMTRGHAYNSLPADGNCQLRYKSVSSPSFTHRQAETLVAGLCEFQFPKPTAQNGDSCSSSHSFDTTRLAGVARLPSPRCCSPLESSPSTPRLNNPPSPHLEDVGSASQRPIAKPGNPNLPACPPTPARLPNEASRSGAQLRGVRSADALDKSPFRVIEDRMGDLFDRWSLNRSYSQSSIAPSAHSFCSSTLREPGVKEFLNLSDDDIAESAPESPALGPLRRLTTSALPPMDLSISSSEPLASALLTLTPPRASRPAAAAAFEAARIARRHDFDLVYVVNLWPDTSKPIHGHGTQKPMIGRLLAAHGLHHVPSPLQVAADVHSRILRADGWIEYRNHEAMPQDFARGYACAFYTGQYPRNPSARCASPVSGVRLSERIDRGIVFAAYRKPRDGNGGLGRDLGEEELGELHRDAEALVEMVLDIHVANRNRQQAWRASLADETGPIPAQPIEVA
ncbi:uncharacterized protein UV8b_02548 [Ustilaginoidea virens]|uniref:Uncharacterized protein n=1 Tax=Ustilaginoidea virens TaxID=1159556 RepID=A0A063BS13_USTVR|nr:uncharacterized protein UV8b_02548 [Ustilaginoidea virens]QUC18307.1 hypothetical protein UV8b_02548 [Ustilaginoidea virens]GAO16151.1 hypothetical protein UVI_02040460 [Ustilaginoidea virens]